MRQGDVARQKTIFIYRCINLFFKCTAGLINKKRGLNYLQIHNPWINPLFLVDFRKNPNLPKILGALPSLVFSEPKMKFLPDDDK